ncbi:LysR family transcriptional regulator, mexEF-oprN operon transcriptional activator [Paraburkholderia fungorum]|uniref:LysR family transcriptional regulator, mexEF-oprN operon transcriptional activator n=1 Tax=Paraburkholderia fungorum TaxID=134537 RepID=A0A1H1JJ99_9BURK|nr:LysR family transcriptional regulator [Paraburkholderia fungorum]SDR50044.1 LysR family transcriptional regulator, mexEF-oprN operon transcriptional activator [Paraburkholderia fungorum]
MSNIIENDFRHFDLNLLLTFRALLEERSVTRAAQRLFLGQPAVSGALKRLRDAFGDELFVRTSRGIVPTSRALELSRQIEPFLQSLHQVMTQSPVFDPASAQRVFRIGLSDSLEVLMTPEIMDRLTVSAPGVKLIVRPTDSTRAAAMLDEGEIELAVGVFPDGAQWHRRRRLFQWRFVSVFNPHLVKTRRKRLSMEEFLRHRHILTSFSAGLHGFIDERLELQGLKRDVVFSSANFATSPFIVRRTPAIATVPDFIGRVWRDALDLAISPLPFEVPGYEVSLMWAAARDQDPGLAWLTQEFADAFGEGEGERENGKRQRRA